MPADYSLSDITYGDGIFVAVGEYGRIVTSPDGTNWTVRTSGAYDFLYGVTYGNGIFVAVGGHYNEEEDKYYGEILTSSDGENWTVRTVETDNNSLTGVTYGNGIFVAVEKYWKQLSPLPMARTGLLERRELIIRWVQLLMEMESLWQWGAITKEDIAEKFLPLLME